MDFKLIGLDLDGTTLDNRGKLSARTQKALENAYESGVHVVIATGRNFTALPDVLRNLNFIQYTITSNGGEIRDYKTQKSIYKNHIGIEGAKAVYEYLKNRSYMIEIFIDGMGFIGNRDFENIKNGLISYRTAEYVIKTRTPVDDIFVKFKENLSCIENINIFFETTDEKNKMREELKSFTDINVTSSLIENLEIGRKDTSKATGIKFIADRLQIDTSKIICFGDGLNDLEMIKMAGMGVAMGNATDDVKAKADYITDPNSEDGVAKVIEKFVLKDN